MIINCLVVDDEQPAREILVNYIGQLSSLRLVATCSDALSAFQVLQLEKIDLIFLDIQMPGLNGVQLMRNLSSPPKVIFTTAFSDYALDGFDLGATDYLLKPFSFERFIKAISRVFTNTEPLEATNSSTTSADENMNGSFKSHLFLRADKVLHKINTSDILYLNAYGNYTKVFTTSKMLIVHESLTSFESKLNPEFFARSHKSFIVSVEKITKVEGNRVYIGKHEIPIGEAFRRELQTKLT